jgi:hypothetical protein
MWGFTLVNDSEIRDIERRCIDADLSEVDCETTQTELVNLVARRNLVFVGAVASTSIAVGGGTLTLVWPW